jgi:hypothetical protein
MRDILFISPENIYERSAVHKNIDSKMIVPEIKAAQEMYILPVLGTALYDRLQDGVNNNNLTADEQTLIKSYIRDPLIHYTISELAPALSFQLWNKGLTRKTTENSEAVSSSEIDDFTAKFKNRAEWYLERLIRYLIQEAGEGNKFQEYINPGSRTDTFVPKRTSFEIGIYLGNTDVSKKEMPKWYKYEFLSCCR